MLKKGYDILSWIWLVLLIVLFAYMWYSANSVATDLFDKNTEAINSGNFSQIRENMDNAAINLPQEIAPVYILKYLLYGLGGNYSIIIFILCFKLKAEILDKLIVLIGGVLTYGGLAILTYFFDIRKKFSPSNAQLISSTQYN